MEACDPKASSVGFDEEDGEDVSSSAEELDYDDSEEDPTYDVLEETSSKLSRLSLKKSKSRTSKTVGLARKLELDDAEIKAPEELNETDKKCFKKVEEIIKADGLQKLTVEQCKVYLRKHGLRLTGKKDILIERIREHLSIINGEGEEKYPVSSFVLNCKGEACTGDVVMFEQNVYEMFSIASRSATGPPIGTRIVAGRIVKESYGAAKQQHTFTVEVLWSKGFKPLPPLHPLLIKGRNLYRLRTMRQRWDDEEERKKILQEKHSRGCVARSNRETRIQEKEMRKRGLRKGSKSFPDQKRLPQPNGRSSIQAWQENVQPEKQKKQDEPAHQKNEFTLFQQLIRANPANPVLFAGVDMDKNIQSQPKIIKSSNSTILANTVHGQRLTGIVGVEMHQKNSEIPNRQPLTNLNASINLKHMQERGHPVGKLWRQEDIVQGMCLHSEDNLRRQEYFEQGRHHYEKSRQQDYYAQEKRQYKDKLQQQEYHVEDRHSHEYYSKYRKEQGRHHYEKSWQQDYHAQEKHQYKDKLQQQEYHVEDRHSREYYSKYHKEQGRHHEYYSKYHKEQGRHHYENSRQQEYHVEERHSHEYYSKYHKEQGRHHYEKSRQLDYYAQENRQYKDKLQQQEYHVEERHYNEYYSKYHKEFTCNYVNKKRWDQPPQQLCQFYAQGRCHYGDRCKYLHEKERFL